MGYQSIYNRLRSAGLSENGALALLGNWDCESNCESVRVQSDFDSFRRVSKEYVAQIDSGRLSRETFKNDQKGFGLAQWTYFTRKAALYDLWKSRGGSIGDEALQVDFAMLELRSDFPGLLSELEKDEDLYCCVKDVCYKFENPAVKNVDQRYNSAVRIKSQLELSTGGDFSSEPVTPDPVETPVPGWAKIPATEWWPPRGAKGGKDDPGLCVGMKGKDVEVLCAILKAREFGVNYVTDEFGTFLEEQVRAFQEAYELDVDGIVGPITWGRLLEAR